MMTMLLTIVSCVAVLRDGTLSSEGTNEIQSSVPQVLIVLGILVLFLLLTVYSLSCIGGYYSNATGRRSCWAVVSSGVISFMMMWALCAVATTTHGLTPSLP
jgi:putative exporter of polyketide antibiotics